MMPQSWLSANIFALIIIIIIYLFIYLFIFSILKYLLYLNK